MASKKLWSDKKEGFKKKLHSWTVMVFSYTNNISWMKSSKLSKFHSSELSKFHTKIGVSTIEIDFCLLIFSSEKILEKRLFRELLWCWRSFTFRVDKLIWFSNSAQPRRWRAGDEKVKTLEIFWANVHKISWISFLVYGVTLQVPT